MAKKNQKSFIDDALQESCLNFIKNRMGVEINPEDFNSYIKQMYQIINILRRRFKLKEVEIDDKVTLDAALYGAIAPHQITYDNLNSYEDDGFFIQIIRLLFFIRGYTVGLHNFWDIDLNRAFTRFKTDTDFSYYSVNNKSDVLVSRDIWGYLLDWKKVKFDAD